MKEMEFGEKVRAFRESRSLTREEFCGDESELTVRQLMRIESGVSKPTLAKIQFIAKRLGMTLFELMPDFIHLPVEYQNLKYKILRTPTYGDPELLEKKEGHLTTIYDLYYDDLPEEEKIVMDTISSMNDVYIEADAQFAQYILNDYFHQVMQKKTYGVNDLLILHLYFLSLGNVANVYRFNRDEFDAIIECLLEQKEKFISDVLFVFRDVLLLAVNIGRRFECHAWSMTIFDALDELMCRFQDFQKKPILNMLMWKHYLEVEDDRARAEELYQEAILFAKMTKQGYLVLKLQEEWQTDVEG